jgi:integrase
MADKARITYAEFLVRKQLNEYAVGTIAWLIERYVRDMASPEMHQIGPSKRYTLRVIQRAPIGSKVAADLKRSDLIEFARALRAGTAGRKKGLHQSTVNGYVTTIGLVFKHAIVEWEDCAKLTTAMFKEAHDHLKKHNIVGKAGVRTRRPTDEELVSIRNYYSTPNKRGKKRTIPMLPAIAVSLISARRLGEIFRITHGDVDYEQKIYWVRDCKHPTKKKGNDKSFMLLPELAALFRQQPRLTDDPNEKIFKGNPKSASASYTNAKKALGILDLRFHDNRGESCSRWLLVMPPEDVADLISGHDEIKTLRNHYDRRTTQEIVSAKYLHLMSPDAPKPETRP